MMLYHGDSLKILPTIQSNSFDTSITDSPYSSAFVGHFYEVLKKYQNGISLNKKRKCNTWNWFGVPGYWSDNYYKTNKEYEEFTYSWMYQINRILMPGGLLASFGSHKLIHVNTQVAITAGFILKDILIWHYKPNFSKGMSLARIGGEKKCKTLTASAYEPILILQKSCEGNNLENYKRYGTGFIDTEVIQSNIITCQKPTKKERMNNPHYAVKPVSLVEKLCRGLCAKKVIDPFMGSGTIGEVCAKLRLSYLGIEIEEDFFNYAKNRVLVPEQCDSIQV